jgi:hypothetical protein
MIRVEDFFVEAPTDVSSKEALPETGRRAHLVQKFFMNTCPFFFKFA